MALGSKAFGRLVELTIDQRIDPARTQLAIAFGDLQEYRLTAHHRLVSTIFDRLSQLLSRFAELRLAHRTSDARPRDRGDPSYQHHNDHQLQQGKPFGLHGSSRRIHRLFHNGCLVGS